MQCLLASRNSQNCLLYHISKLSVRRNTFSGYAQRLVNRSLLKLTGKDSTKFLQGLITNDVNHLKDNLRCLYTFMLNNKGRILYDLFIYKHEDGYLVECDSEVFKDLSDRLKLFVLRSKVQIENWDEKYFIWQVFQYPCASENESKKFARSNLELHSHDVCVDVDPRTFYLGNRVVSSSLKNWSDQADLIVDKNNGYKDLRFVLGVPEGPSEIIKGKSLPLEYNADILNGVSFQKGCYVGQELTARTFHTGVVRKRVLPFTVMDRNYTSTNNVDIKNDRGKIIGKSLSLVSSKGLGLITVNEVKNSSLFLDDGTQITCSLPLWWPDALKFS